jgi:hypothetical protein
MSNNTPGNRQDNRQRGNAAQLLEKYKSLARDSQLAGDRVQTEYYLQYADHYFRVLEESRSRFEQNEAQRRPRRDDEDYESEGDEEMAVESDSGEDGEAEVRQQPARDRGRERGRDRYERDDRPQARGNGEGRGDRTERQGRDEEDEVGERISLGVLPPSIGASDDSEEEAPKPRRRARKPRPEETGDEDIAPAA